MHVDIDNSDIEAEADRLEALGVHRVDAAPHREHGSNWIVMADPEDTSSASATGGLARAGH